MGEREVKQKVGKQKAEMGKGMLLALLMAPALAGGGIVGLAWEESESVTNVAVQRVCGYRVYSGLASREYRWVTRPKPQGALICWLHVDRSVTNYLAVTAVSNSGEESQFSEEVVVGPRAAPRTNLVVTVVCGAETLVLTNPVDGPRWWTNASISKEWR